MAIGRTDWNTDSRFVKNRDRLANRQQLREEMALVLKESPTETWLEKFGQYGVPASPVQAVSHGFSDGEIESLAHQGVIRLA